MGPPGVSDPGPVLRSEGVPWLWAVRWLWSVSQTAAGWWRCAPCELAEMKRWWGDLWSEGPRLQWLRGVAGGWCSVQSVWMKGRLQQLKVWMWGQCCINLKQYRGFFKENEPYTQQPAVTLHHPAHEHWSLPLTLKPPSECFCCQVPLILLHNTKKPSENRASTVAMTCFTHCLCFHASNQQHKNGGGHYCSDNNRYPHKRLPPSWTLFWFRCCRVRQRAKLSALSHKAEIYKKGYIYYKY